jgi:hypothetical protein
MDKFTRFANTWKSVGVTSRVKWQQRSTLDRFNVMLIRRLTDKYGEDARAMTEDVAYQIGLEDGEKICENMNLDTGLLASVLVPLETIALLSGTTPRSTATKSPGSSHLSFKCGGCIFSRISDSMDRTSASASAASTRSAWCTPSTRKRTSRCCEGAVWVTGSVSSW